jgi:3-hydroxyisobutyrate dehydrogenase-like beta-hydroxyacid dehydrogenase
MEFRNIAIVSPGAMGYKVGAFMAKRGHRILTLLEGRSAETIARAKRAGMDGMANMAALAAEADLFLSILPPASAEAMAHDFAAAVESADRAPVYVDCNAVSPGTAGRISTIVAAAGAKFIDVGIIGPPPGEGLTKFYASGPDAGLLEFLEGDGISVRNMGTGPTRASAIKMCYAGLTKGTFTLHTAILLAAEMLGVADEFHTELADSQKGPWEAMNKRVPFLAADAGRWIGEMEEIAATLASTGLTDDFHHAAADIFRLLDASPLGAETRETQDKNRGLNEAIRIYADAAKTRKAAE